LAEIGGRLVRALKEIQKHFVGIVGLAHGFVGQQEFAEIRVEARGGATCASAKPGGVG
jgi:hypothetical protein